MSMNKLVDYSYLTAIYLLKKITEFFDMFKEYRVW